MARKRFKFEKLARDKAIERMEKKGWTVHQADKLPRPYITLLKEKLTEEAAEVVATTDTVTLIDEMADVLEVMHALLKVHCVTMAAVEESRREKLVSRGGFNKQVYITHLEIDEDNPHIDYVLKQPHKYPEIT